MKFILIAIIVLVAFFIYNRNANIKLAEENIQIGEEFLAQNKLAEGVMTTESGLQYLVMESGNGEEHPSATSKVTVHYHGTLIDGTVFDSSVERGQSISFGLNQVIKGWTEGVQLMKAGDKFKFFIPSYLGYGNQATGKIKPGSLLIFEVQLLEIN